MNEIHVHETPYGGIITRYFNTAHGRDYARLLINTKGVETLKQHSTQDNRFLNALEERGFPASEIISITGSRKYFIPIHFQIELTDLCNLACPYCYRDSTFMENGTFVDYKHLLEVLEIYRELGLREIGITGGEPALHPKFSRILAFVLKKFPFVELITNGTNPEPILKAIKGNKYSYRLSLSISFNMWTKEAEAFLNGSHYLNNTLEKIGKLVPTVCILTDTHFNETYAKEIEKKMKEDYFVVKIYINIAMPFGRGSKCTSIEEWLKLSEHNTKDEEIRPALIKNNCGLPLRHLTIAPNGEVRPCAVFPIEYSLGNIFEQKENFYKLKSVQSLARFKCPNEEICDSCAYYKYCEGCIRAGLQGSNCAYKQYLKECGFYEIFGSTERKGEG